MTLLTTKPEREIPWCMLILVVAAVTCHTLVLTGNFQTSSALLNVGSSTSGWSKVGLGIGRSFNEELSAQMYSATESLTDALAQIAQVQELMDSVISQVGDAADSATEELGTAFLQLSSGGHPVTQKVNGTVQSALGDAKSTLEEQAELAKEQLKAFIVGKVNVTVQKVIGELSDELDKFLEKIQPALETVNQYVEKFKDSILAALEGFSGTLDNVQKLFDQVMAQLNSDKPEDTEELMIHDTFTLFDVSDTGEITLKDLQEVSKMYAIDALQGTKPDELISTYDADGDGALSVDEFTLMVTDPSIPGVMSVVLRSYAKRLSEVAGKVGDAQMRDELSEAVVHYFQLVCSKNKTKMSWVSDMLSNGTLPVEFSADILGQLALAVDDPDVLTDADVGQLVVGEMFHLNTTGLLLAYDRLCNQTFWAEEGFDPLDFAVVVERVTDWITKAKQDEFSTSLTEEEEVTKLVLNQLMAEMPAMAHEKAKRSMSLHFTERRKKKLKRHKALFSSKSSKFILSYVAGGRAASNDVLVAATAAEKAIASGQPCAEVTLVFAQWLSWNASDTADRFQAQCFDDSSTSSSPLDSFSQQIAGLVKKIPSFLEMMEKYSDPGYLDNLVTGFKEQAGEELLNAVDQLVTQLLESVDSLDTSAMQGIIDTVEEQVIEPLEEAVAKIEGEVEEQKEKIKDQVEEQTHKLKDEVGKQKQKVQDEVGKQKQKVQDEIGKQKQKIKDEVGKTKQHVVKKVKGAIQQAPHRQMTPSKTHQQRSATKQVKGLSQLQFSSAAARRMEEDALSGVFDQLITVLQSLNNMLPLATSVLKEARTTVASAASQIDSVFDVLGDKAPGIFDDIASLWKMVWTLYFCIFCPLTLLLLLYSFWASGYCGGPRKGQSMSLPESPTCCDRLRVCCNSCCMCFSGYHDMALCFWSLTILMQVLVLIIFVICIVLCLLAAVKAFLMAGCSQVYMLNDSQICLQTLQMFKGFLDTFFVGDASEDLAAVCTDNALLACNDLSEKMETSVILTTCFSFLAALFSFQMILETSVLHEQAYWRRKLDTEDDASAVTTS